VQQAPNDLRDRFTGMYTALGVTCIYSPWFWLLLNMAGFVGFLYCSRREAINAVGAGNLADAHSAGSLVGEPRNDENRLCTPYRIRYWQLHAWIQLSGVLYTLSQFPVYQHDRDFRYNYWNVFVALIAVAAMAGKATKGRKGRSK
jgi:hypothetical protein